MMEIIRSWLVGSTCAAMVVALAEGLMPQGAVRRIGRLTGGLVLLLAVTKPLIGLDPSALSLELTGEAEAWSGESTALEQTNDDLLKTIIAQRTGAYILDKAAALGATCQVVVTVGPTEEGGYPVPQAVTVSGDLTGQQCQLLTQTIAADLGIPPERQHYERGEEA